MLYQGQYYDFETNLAYNRFRYYSPETGGYISQDPIRLLGSNPNLYAYVANNNWWVDVFGLDCENNELDWTRERLDGLTTIEHVELDNNDNRRKKYHGVFADDAITQTNKAWENKELGTVETQNNGNDKYLIPVPESGLEGGRLGSGDILDKITIITEGGTNKVVTAYPSKD